MKPEAQQNNDIDRAGRCLSMIMDMGEILLTCGAEVSRVEDTIMRLCRAYGFTRSDVFTITSSIVVTAATPEGCEITNTRRIKERGTDLGKVEMVNALSRRICAKPEDLEEFRAEIAGIRRAAGTPERVKLAMYMAISFSLSVFFGGDWLDGLAAAVSGAVLFASLYASAALKLNNILQTMLCSAVTALSVLLLVGAGFGTRPDKIMIGNIMLVIPGIQLTTSLRDMINGDTISGLLNMIEALLKAVFVAMGFALVLLMKG